jgi:hypothetical protein
MDSTVIVLIVVIVLLVIALVGLGAMLAKRKTSERLQQRFGPEYEHKLSETGDRKATESELRKREQRRSKLDIRELRPEERERYRHSWDQIQRGFVDDPEGALHDADWLVTKVMRARGYPVDDFERRAEDISVDHPDVVRHYRDAHAVHDASASGSVDTERQRHALTAYRSLVDALLGRDSAPRSDSTPDTGTEHRTGSEHGTEHGTGTEHSGVAADTHSTDRRPAAHTTQEGSQ